MFSNLKAMGYTQGFIPNLFLFRITFFIGGGLLGESPGFVPFAFIMIIHLLNTALCPFMGSLFSWAKAIDKWYEKVSSLRVPEVHENKMISVNEFEGMPVSVR